MRSAIGGLEKLPDAIPRRPGDIVDHDVLARRLKFINPMPKVGWSADGLQYCPTTLQATIHD